MLGMCTVCLLYLLIDLKASSGKQAIIDEKEDIVKVSHELGAVTRRTGEMSYTLEIASSEKNS